MKKKSKQLPPKTPINTDDIIEYCQQNFINILPNTISKQSNNQYHSKHTTQTLQHQKQQLKIIIKQLSILLQLTIQNCVLTCDPKIKYHSNMILRNFEQLLSRDLDDFQNLAKNRNRIKLPFYEVQCKDFVHRQVSIKIPPQVSLYQDPLLYYKYSKYAQQQLFCNLSIMKTRQQRIELLKNHTPFLDPIFIPIIGQRLQTKAKFSELEDRLLLILLKLHDKKDISEFKHIYFPNRVENQIRNRAKNLCAKQLINPIKKFRENQYLLFNQSELKTLMKSYKRYGARWPVISKYYNLRSASMLQAQFQNCPKLAKLRKSYNLPQPSYSLMSSSTATSTKPGGVVTIKDILQQQQQKYENEQQQNKCKHKQKYKQQQGDNNGASSSQQFDDTEMFEQVYKIIGHLTFLYEQI